MLVSWSSNITSSVCRAPPPRAGWGTESPVSPGPSADPCLMPSQPWAAAVLLGKLQPGSWQQELPRGPCTRLGHHNLCFAWGEGVQVSQGGLSALAWRGGLLSPSQSEN